MAHSNFSWIESTSGCATTCGGRKAAYRLLDAKGKVLNTRLGRVEKLGPGWWEKKHSKPSGYAHPTVGSFANAKAKRTLTKRISNASEDKRRLKAVKLQAQANGLEWCPVRCQFVPIGTPQRVQGKRSTTLGDRTVKVRSQIEVVA